MQRLLTSLDIKQFCAGYMAAFVASCCSLNQQVYKAVMYFFKDKRTTGAKKNQTKGKKVLNRLFDKSIFDILYNNQFCHLFNKVKNKLVNKRRLIDPLDQYVSSTIGIGNVHWLWAYTGRMVYDFSFTLLGNRLRINAERLITYNTYVFQVVRADSRFKTEGRRAVMA